LFIEQFSYKKCRQQEKQGIKNDQNRMNKSVFKTSFFSVPAKSKNYQKKAVINRIIEPNMLF